MTRVEISASEYQRQAARTINSELSFEEINNHALFGMASEVGELHGLYQKVYQGHELDYDHVKKECGDLLWFIAEFCTNNGFSLSEVMQTNINKLKARYPEGFEVDKSLYRVEGDI